MLYWANPLNRWDSTACDRYLYVSLLYLLAGHWILKNCLTATQTYQLDAHVNYRQRDQPALTVVPEHIANQILCLTNRLA
jgi:hypothetical protein